MYPQLMANWEVDSRPVDFGVLDFQTNKNTNVPGNSGGIIEHPLSVCTLGRLGVHAGVSAQSRKFQSQQPAMLDDDFNGNPI